MGKIAPVNVKPFGDVLKLNFQDSGKYAGIIKLPAMRKLLDECDIQLSATLTMSPPASVTAPKNNTKQPDPQECVVRIILYGRRQDRFTVGNLLSDADLYLQQPSAIECSNDVEYWNPHYLVRPGCRMPELDQLSISTPQSTTPPAEVLSEVNKSRLMRIFDLANDEGISSEVKPSNRLRSTLKP